MLVTNIIIPTLDNYSVFLFADDTSLISSNLNLEYLKLDKFLKFVLQYGKERNTF